MSTPVPIPSLASPPWEGLRARLLACVAARAAAGDAAGAGALAALVESWWEEQQRWNAGIARLLTLHHEINNALVGVSGNAQLLLMGPAGQEPGVRQRLEVVLRESRRIQEAVLELRRVRELLTAAPPQEGPAPAGHEEGLS